MGRLRLFFAVSVPERIEVAVSEFIRAHRDLEVRWVASENLHVTVLYLGATEEQALGTIGRRAREICAAFPASAIRFTHFDWAPPRRTPRMIWLYGEADEVWGTLKASLREALAAQRIYRGTDERPFTAHLTIARMAERARRDLEEIRTPFRSTIVPSELLLLASTLSREGARYRVLERYAFSREAAL